MAILSILKYPDERLRIMANPVGHVDENIRQLVSDMAQTLYAAPGIGLAATQVNVHKRVIVIDISETKDNLLVLINPRIVESTGQQQFEEGCLSVPGIYEAVIRAENIFVKALNKEGKAFNLRADGLLSVCIQHEMDHLKGRVFVEYLSQLKQTRIRQKLKKMARVTL